MHKHTKYSFRINNTFLDEPIYDGEDKLTRNPSFNENETLHLPGLKTYSAKTLARKLSSCPDTLKPYILLNTFIFDNKKLGSSRQ